MIFSGWETGKLFKVSECQGFHEEPRCAVACPVDCCVPDEMCQESEEELLAKKDKLHR